MPLEHHLGRRKGRTAARGSALVLLLLASAAVRGEEEGAAALRAGDQLPTIRGTFLSGRRAVLPDAARGKVALLAVGFSYGSRRPVEAWTERFRREFPDGDRITFYEIPMIGGLGRLAGPFIDRGMRRGTPKELHENVMTVYGGTAPWKARLGYHEADAAYLVLIDDEGRVTWQFSGPLSEERFHELATIVRGTQTPHGE